MTAKVCCELGQRDVVWARPKEMEEETEGVWLNREFIVWGRSEDCGPKAQVTSTARLYLGPDGQR